MIPYATMCLINLLAEGNLVVVLAGASLSQPFSATITLAWPAFGAESTSRSMPEVGVVSVVLLLLLLLLFFVLSKSATERRTAPVLELEDAEDELLARLFRESWRNLEAAASLGAVGSAAAAAATLIILSQFNSLVIFAKHSYGPHVHYTINACNLHRYFLLCKLRH